MKTRLLFLLVSLYVLQFNIAIAATTYTWKGGAAGAWNSLTNWSSSTGLPGYPGSNLFVTSDIAVINTNNVNITFSAALPAASIDQLEIGQNNTVTITFSGNHTLPIATQLTIGGSQATSLTFAGTGTNLGVVTIGTALNFEYQSAFTVASGITVNFADGCNVTMSGNSPGLTSPSINNSGTLNFNGSTTGCKITGYYQELYTNTGTINATNTTWAFGTTAESILNNTGTITMSAGSSITPGYQGQINNNSGGVFYAGITNSSCTINLSAQGASLTNAGIFYLGPTSILNFTGTSTSSPNGYGSLVTNTGTFTLQSDASGSATIASITSSASTPSLKGLYSVQRYITGGSSGYRGYRFLSSPVNITDALPQTTQHNIGLSYLTAGMLTGGPGGTAGGFTMTTTNPLIYLFDETRPVNHVYYTGGENVGVNSISGNTPAYSVVTIQSNTARTLNSPILVPVGNAYLVYYVGTSTNGLNSTTPSSTTVTATGYLNQGTIPVYVTNGVTSSTTMSYTPITTTHAATPGLHQIGNPYPSTIDLNVLYADNSSSITSIFDELQEPNGAYVSYNASSGTTSSSTAGEYIVSGQGFFAHASSASKLTFSEDQKISTQLTSSTSPPLLLSQKSKTVSAITASEMLPTGLSGLHLQLNQDSLTHTQTGIYFSSSWSDKYVPQEDGIDEDGASVYLSSYSSDNQRLSINQLGDYSTSRKVVKLYVSAASYGAFKLSLADIKNIDTLYNVYLRDHLLNDSVNLRTATAPYSFNITADTASYGSNRFDLVLEREALPPYQLLTFTGQKMTSSVQLNWVANGAGTYTGFVLEKEGADNSFNPIYTTQSNNSSKYSFVDNNPVIGNNIYRLAQNDINGNITYSSLITIGYNNVTSNGYFSVYPNPSKSIINVLINSTAASTANYTADIYNTSGMSMDHRILNTYSWTEDVSSYKEGVYIIVLKDTNGDVLAKSKFIKIK